MVDPIVFNGQGQVIVDAAGVVRLEVVDDKSKKFVVVIDKKDVMFGATFSGENGASILRKNGKIAWD